MFLANGSGGRTRTGSLQIRNLAFYPLNHTRTDSCYRFHSVFIQPFADRLEIAVAFVDRLGEHHILRNRRRQGEPRRPQQLVGAGPVEPQRYGELDGRPLRDRPERVRDDRAVGPPVYPRGLVDGRGVAALRPYMPRQQIGERAAP